MNQLDFFKKNAGVYRGEGINHDGEEFMGELKIHPIIDGRGVEITFLASGTDGKIYHQEKTTIAKNDKDGLSLWTLNSNVPFQYEHRLLVPDSEQHQTSYIFRYNKPEDQDQFREDITLDFTESDELSYRYSWGLPGGEFLERSSAKMKRLSK